MSEDAAAAKGKHFYSCDTQLREVETKTAVYLLSAGRDYYNERVMTKGGFLPHLTQCRDTMWS